MAQTFFPSPAEDLGGLRLDVVDLLQTDKPDSFFMRVADPRWQRWGVHRGDIVVVRRNKIARPGHLVVACIDGELVLQRLPARHQATQAIDVWGVVTASIHMLEP
ncbi:hypothetical protein KIK84_04655 [Curvibacter sp. CHRR-16]|uniref:LexA family protein n=1 Tax=Curvibacter sp. CHRR-16 TaxID=2835872 RepID=UPI001BD9B729|nr:S24 family peptidase [Curvibacter sp. CHRR-16]MBT0569603.1 hypothetical protein [Curvibacter sp. CHRR-16]